MKQNPVVVISGNLGAGKTTLAKRLGRHFGWWVGFESVKDNPYLKDFYENMERWSFNLQVYFLGNRMHLHKKAALQPHGAVLDRSIYEDRYIFAEALHDKGLISTRDFASYVQVFDLVVQTLPEPDLTIYVSAPVPILGERLKRRNQAFDRNLAPEYLNLIDDMYRSWKTTLAQSRLLEVDSTVADFESDSTESPELADILNRVAKMLE
jgi:deoxyadenosine/deoxycytidine kinase